MCGKGGVNDRQKKSMLERYGLGISKGYAGMQGNAELLLCGAMQWQKCNEATTGICCLLGMLFSEPLKWVGGALGMAWVKHWLTLVRLNKKNNQQGNVGVGLFFYCYGIGYLI